MRLLFSFCFGKHFVFFSEQVCHALYAYSERRGVMQKCRECRLQYSGNAARNKHKIKSHDKAVVPVYVFHSNLFPN